MTSCKLPRFHTGLSQNPQRELRLGFDTKGRALEVVVLTFDSCNELMIHAMKAREQYFALQSDTAALHALTRRIGIGMDGSANVSFKDGQNQKIYLA